jgi:hypothetical protein
MPQITVTAVARDIAARVDQSKVSFGFEIFIPLIAQVLNSLLSGCGKQAEPDPAKLSANVRARNESNPKRLLREMTSAFMRDARPHKVKRSEAEEFAKQTIAEACESSPARVASVARSVQA